MILSSIEDFVLPVLKLLDGLGGQAWLSEVEDEFYKRYAGNLDPAKDWHKKTHNHNKELWRDYCGSRGAYHHLTLTCWKRAIGTACGR